MSARALDFINHPSGSGGLDNIADIRTILASSKEHSDPEQHYDQNVIERIRMWTDGVLQESIPQQVITRDTIQKNFTILYDVLSICNAKWGLMEHPVGCVFSNSIFTEYSANNITLKVLYELDQTQLATISHISEKRPETINAVSYTNIVRHFKFTKTLWQVMAQIDSEVFQDLLKALNLVMTQRFTEGAYRTYVGENQNNPLDEPESKAILMQINAFFAHIQKRHSSAMKAQSASHTNAAVIEVVSNSPYACALPRHPSVLNNRTTRDIYLNSLANDEVMLYGLNKWDGCHPEMRNTENSIEALMTTFETNTDNITTLPENLPTVIIDGKEAKPKVYVWFMQQTMDYLLAKTNLIKTKQGQLVQSMTKISLNANDFNPMNAMAIHDSVTQKGTSFLRDQNGGFSKDTYVVDCQLHTMNIKGKLAIACALDKSVLTRESINQTGLRKVSSFDMIIPQGTVMTDTGRTSHPGASVLRPSTVSFMDHHGITHTIPEPDWNSDRWRDFVQATFNPFHCVPDKDYSSLNINVKPSKRGLRLFDDFGRLMFRGVFTYDDNLYRPNRKYQQKDNHVIRDVGESFLFYRKHPVDKADVLKSGGSASFDLSVEEAALELHSENAIALNDLVIDNHYFDMNLFVNNVICCMYNYEKFSKLLDEMMGKIRPNNTENYPSKEEESEFSRLASRLTKGYKIECSGKGVEYDKQVDGFALICEESELFNIEKHPKRKAYANTTALVSSVMNQVITGLEALNMPLPIANGRKELDDIMKQRLCEVVYVLRLFPNSGYTLVPNMLNYINPGWSLNWLLELLVEDEAVVMNRPASYMNVKTIPVTRRTENREIDLVQYTTKMNVAIHKQALNYGSIIDPHAYFSRSITRTTGYCLGPEEFSDHEWSKNYGLIYSGYADNETTACDDEGDTELSPWIPLIAAPYQSANWWSTHMSPVGRLAGHYDSQEDFNNRFYNLNENDILHTGCYTMNSVWTNMNVNINRCLLIRPEVYCNKNFPLYKYVNYNHSSTLRNNSFRNNVSRLNRTKTYADMDAEVSSTSFSAERPILSKLYSTVRGIALPKHCATTADQISASTVKEAASTARRSGVIHTSQTNFYDYRITGSTSLEKFDKHGVNHFTFY